MSEREDGSEMAVRLVRGEWDEMERGDRSLKTFNLHEEKHELSLGEHCCCREIQEMLQVGFEWGTGLPGCPLYRGLSRATPLT